jgi:hypothetical protein
LDYHLASNDSHLSTWNATFGSKDAFICSVAHEVFVKMAHSISDVFYGVVQWYLLYGTRQGSGAPPSVWLSIVVCLLSALTILAPIAMAFADPWGDQKC